MKGLLMLIWSLIFITIFVSLFIFHTWTRHQNTIIGRKITQQIELYRKLSMENKKLNSELAKLKKMERVEFIAKEILNMHMPEKKEIMWMKVNQKFEKNKGIMNIEKEK